MWKKKSNSDYTALYCAWRRRERVRRAAEFAVAWIFLAAVAAAAAAAVFWGLAVLSRSDVVAAPGFDVIRDGVYPEAHVEEVCDEL